MEQFIQAYPTLVTTFIGLLISYFLWSSNQALSRINRTLIEHEKLLLNFTKELSQLRGEHDAVMRGHVNHD